MGMPGRKFASGNLYRYGFNGKENDNEVEGEGNQQDYGMRIYDPRVGRFLSVDPIAKQFSWYSPYQFAGNKPTWAIDLDGSEEKFYWGSVNTDKPYVKLITTQTEIKHSYFWGLWTNTTKIPERYEVHLDNGGKYFIGFAGPEGAANQGMISLARDLLSQKEFNSGVFLSVFYTEEESIDYYYNGIVNDFKDRTLKYLSLGISTGLVLSENRLLGSNGTQLKSKTVWNSKDSKTARIDVENAAPGKRAGSLHYQDENNVKYQYNVNDKKFYGQDTNGEFSVEAPKSVQKLLEKKDFQKGIDKGLKYLGESPQYGNK